MDSSQRQSQKVNIWGYLIAILGALLFSALILLPYRLHSSNDALAFILSNSSSSKAVSEVPGTKISSLYPANSCNSGATLAKTDQCAEWGPPDSLRSVAVLGTIALVTLAVLSFICSRSVSLKDVKKYVLVQFVLAAIVVFIVITTYRLLHSHSQQSWRYFRASMQPNGQYLITDPPSLGYGLQPLFVVLFSAIYLLVPLANLFNYYRPMIDPRYLAGVKKSKLFE